MGGELTSFSNLDGGWRVEEGSITAFFWGGEAGGVSSPVAGLGPGEQMGMCLFGTAAGVPREEVFRVRCGGGVEVRVGSVGARATMVAIIQGALQLMEGMSLGR